MSLAVVCAESLMSASAIREYVVLIHPTICHALPSYMKATTLPAFQEDARDVDGAVDPYLRIAIAPVPLTFNVGFALLFAFVNFTYNRTPVYNWNV